MSISLKEQLIRVVEQLSEEEQRRLLGLIRKLRRQPKLEGDFLDFIIEEADPKISLAQVRHELSAIQGNLSDWSNIIMKKRAARKRFPQGSPRN